MSAIRLNPLDASWLYTESRATPMHVGALLPFRLPAGAPKDFGRRLMADLRKHQKFAPPWNRRLKSGLLKMPVHHWVDDDDIDLDAHLRHAALPHPGGERELGELIARLHSQPLDLSRPPWECTLIEGLDGGRFAFFVKMHHSLIDGVSGMKLLQRAMPDDAAEEPDRAAVLGRRPAPRARTPSASQSATPAPRPSPTRRPRAIEALRGQIGTVPQLLLAFAKLLRASGPADEAAADALRRTALRCSTGACAAKRRFATQQIADRAHEGAGARGRLHPQRPGAGHLRRRPAALPRPTAANCRRSRSPPASRSRCGPRTTTAPATRSRSSSPRSAPTSKTRSQRLAAIRASVQSAKAHVQSLPRQAMTQYTIALMAPTMLTLLTGLGGRTRPMFNITISNVPGPDKPLYFRGARDAGHLSGLDRHPRPGAQHHLPELRRHDGLRLHRLPASLPHMQRIAVLHRRGVR